ncbi:glucose 1-dehydrogenase [Bartonella sp. HY038]|uniref:glucose 1-dehydrogenase n=1 Tax=Bartonella sp. HY038 TaxID=2759660 RepID=UPI001FEE2A9F|nr:glucose 1-dehydrogenase [Bartonella sp. HY038]
MSKDYDINNQLSLKGKTALITGAGAGFGAAIAQKLALAGANVVLADINLKKADTIAKHIVTDIGKTQENTAIAVQADVTREGDIDHMVTKALQHFKKIDIFIANAGFAHPQADVTDVDEPTFDLILAVNIKSLYYAVKALVPHMKENGGGSIITLGATMAERPQSGFSWFGAAKGWVMSATRALALELAHDNIRVNCVCPAQSDTATFDVFYGSLAEKKRQELINSIPLGRLSNPQDVANAALWLASEQSSFTTGAIIPVDGGYNL